MIRLGEHLADWLQIAGTERVFGLMAAGSIRMVNRLADLGVPFHNARHETGAVAMADGYARTTGKVAVCSVTQGPGVTNALTALITARRARSPLVLIVNDASGADVHTQRFQSLQALDQTEILERLDIPVVEITHDTVDQGLASAFHLARTGSPVVVSIPVGGQHEPVSLGRLVEPPSSIPAALPSEELVGEAAKLLITAKRPVLLAGLGAVRSGAGPAIADLAERSGAILATTLRAIGLFLGSETSVGVMGGFAWPSQKDAIIKADCIFAFGASLNSFTTERGTLLAKTTLVQIDSDPEAFGRFQEVDLRIQADAWAAAQALVRAMPALDEKPPRRAPRRPPLSLTDRNFDDGMDPRSLCGSLDRILPEERTVVTDSGHFALFPVDYISIPDPAALVFPLEFGSMGLGFGAAIGAALGRPDRLAVLFIGDGGFFMTMGELDVAVRDGVRLLVVIMNDRAYGSEVHQMRQLGLEASHAVFDTPDLAVVARAMGARAAQITELDQLDSLPDLIGDWQGPVVIDCLITRSVVARQFVQPGA